MTVDTPEVDRFVRTFQDFLDRVMRGPLAGGDNELVRRLRDHLGEDPLTLPVAEGQWDPFDLVNVHRGLQACLERDGRHSELLGVGGGHHGSGEGLAGLVEAAQRHRAVDVGPVQRQAVATSATTTEVVVAMGLFLAVVDGRPMAVLLAGAHPNRGREKVTVDVMCAAPEVAGAFLDEVRDEAVARSVFRGQVISLDASGFGHELGPVRFRPRPALDRADLVLPAGVLELVERQVLDIGRHRERLRDSGQHLKRGVLLHGPPGTGKTHTVRYLLSRLTGVTVVLLAGQGLRFIGPACALARMLQPAVVVLEDCDLVAGTGPSRSAPSPCSSTYSMSSTGWPRTSTWRSCSPRTARTCWSPPSQPGPAEWTRPWRYRFPTPPRAGNCSPSTAAG